MTLTINGYKIHNIPSYALDYKFIAFREVDGEFWFYGAYSSYESANETYKDGCDFTFNRNHKQY